MTASNLVFPHILRHHGTAPALVSDGRSLSYAELDAWAARAAVDAAGPDQIDHLALDLARALLTEEQRADLVDGREHELHCGHAHVIRRVHAEPSMRGIVLTTEEEGVAIASGAWLGGERAALLMQSSGVGNCINMMSLLQSCRFPFLSLVTMRGEYAEFNPWQVPMSKATQGSMELMGITVLRAERADEVADIVSAALDAAFEGGEQVAVLLSQSLIGRKKWLRN